jgi:hypothetical protein
VICKMEGEKVGKGLTYGGFAREKVSSRKSLGNDVSKQTQIGRGWRARILFGKGENQCEQPANLGMM